MSDPAPSVVRLTPSGERVMRALTAAVIDPGELTWDEVMVRCRPISSQGLSRVAYQLQRDGLVELSGWNGGRYGYLELTELGRGVARERSWPTAVRT